MASRRTTYCFALAAIALSISLIGMTVRGGASTNHATSDAYVKRGQPQHVRAICTSGKVVLGTRPGVVNFSAECSGAATGDVANLVLGRYSRGGDHGTGILRFSHRPTLTGSGAVGSHGVCLAIPGGLGCNAKADGRAKLTGRIWVRKGQQCAKRVELKTPKPPVCNSRGVCIAVARMKILARGLPRGC